MFAELLLATSFQIGPFYEQRQDYLAVRPFFAHENDVTDIVWPIFTKHRDWWRFCYFTSYQSYANDGYQFEIMPLWFNGRTTEGQNYCGLFPIAGYHPHFALLYELKFAFWPLWMQYCKPRGTDGLALKTNAILFPFFHWRSDGAFGVWPLYGRNYQRSSTHRYALWPIITWAKYDQDRDTAGKGYSWMVWPLYAYVNRERENHHMLLPPFFSYATLYDKDGFKQGWSARLPWPLVQISIARNRERVCVFPFYEHNIIKNYGDGARQSSVYRFLYQLIEIYDNETRVFPFWVSRSDKRYFRFWPFVESEKVDDVTYHEVLGLFPIRWIPAVDRNWSKFWTIYERIENPVTTEHSLLWGLIQWRTVND